MKSVLFASTAVLFGLFASCTPYTEPPPAPPTDPATNPGAVEKAPSSVPGDSGRSTAAESSETSTEKPPSIPTETSDPAPEKPDPQPSMQVARPVPGKPGFVFSPFNNKIIDVKGIPTGTLVADPTFPASQKKYFRVP